MGRHRKFDEPTEKISFSIPISYFNFLVDKLLPRRRSIADFVVEIVLAFLDMKMREEAAKEALRNQAKVDRSPLAGLILAKAQAKPDAPNSNTSTSTTIDQDKPRIVRTMDPWKYDKLEQQRVASIKEARERLEKEERLRKEQEREQKQKQDQEEQPAEEEEEEVITGEEEAVVQEEEVVE